MFYIVINLQKLNFIVGKDASGYSKAVNYIIADLEKLINRQSLSYKIFLNDIPISTNLSKFIKLKKLNKKFFISRGDDYQILFTASPFKNRIINKISKSSGIKISKIGKICSISKKSHIIDEKGNKIVLKDKGYYHQF